MVLSEQELWDLEHTLSGSVATLRHIADFIQEHPTSGGFFACGPRALSELRVLANRLENVAEVIHRG